jgi:hypothetical protein
MAQQPDFEQMKALSQPELASVYAERMTYAALQGDSSKDRGGIGTGST